MRAELDEQIGSKSFISYEDMTKLRYTDLVYKEGKILDYLDV